MRIAQITPGLGDNFYCENCLRDVALVRALRKLGHDVLITPMYLPLQTDEGELANHAPIFFGGINVYLQQKSAFFRKTPRWIDRVFDSPKLLRWVAHKARMTSAKDLGRTTISMLRGEEGWQAKELHRLVAWLGTRENKPDLVCLSNILLAGLARRIKKSLDVPVLCLLQDEDGFLDGLTHPYAEQAWEILAQRSNDIDAFVAVSNYYARVMQERLAISSDHVHVAHIGISLDGFQAASEPPQVPTIGYLSRICFEKGLDTLVDAFCRLKQNEKLKNAKLRVAGGQSRNDQTFIDNIKRQLGSHGLTDDVEFLPTFDRGAKLAFLRTLSVLSVPEKKPIAYGLYVLEALASGVPVVEPASGSFPELLELTGGGVLCQPNDSAALADAIESLLLDPNHTRRLGTKGRKNVFEKFNVEYTAQQFVRICEEIVG